MGLNEVYMPVRTQILSMVPRPKMQQVYAMLIQEEDSQGTARKPSVTEMSALHISQSYNTTGQNQSRTFGNNNSGQAANKGNRKKLFCTYCQTAGHTRDFCYKFNGYSQGHKLYEGNNSNNNNFRGNKAVVNNVTISDDTLTRQSHSGEDVTTEQKLQLGSLRVSQKQMDKLMAMLEAPEKGNGSSIAVSSITINDNLAEFIPEKGNGMSALVMRKKGLLVLR